MSRGGHELASNRWSSQCVPQCEVLLFNNIHGPRPRINLCGKIIVVVDNLAVHKRTEIAIAIEAVGARLLYLQPYSPDLNPIEMAFARLKASLRKAATRSIEDLVDAIARALATFTAQECLNFYIAAGYDRV
jgi:transposase